MSVDTILEAIDAKIGTLQQVRNLLTGGSMKAFTSFKSPAHNGGNGFVRSLVTSSKRRGTMSPEARKRIGEATRKRWAERKRLAAASAVGAAAKVTAAKRNGSKAKKTAAKKSPSVVTPS